MCTNNNDGDDNEDNNSNSNKNTTTTTATTKQKQKHHNNENSNNHDNHDNHDNNNYHPSICTIHPSQVVPHETRFWNITGPKKTPRQCLEEDPGVLLPALQVGAQLRDGCVSRQREASVFERYCTLIERGKERDLPLPDWELMSIGETLVICGGVRGSYTLHCPTWHTCV